MTTARSSRPSILWLTTALSFALLLTLSPFNFVQTSDSFSWRYQTSDFRDNLLLLSVIGFCFTCTKPIRWWHWPLLLALGSIISFGIETAQLALPDRTSQYWDVIANTISLVAGGVAGLFFRRLTIGIDKHRLMQLLPLVLLCPAPLIISEFFDTYSILLLASIYSLVVIATALVCRELFSANVISSTVIFCAAYYTLLLSPFIVAYPAEVCLLLLISIAICSTVAWSANTSNLVKLATISFGLSIGLSTIYLLNVKYHTGITSPIDDGINALICLLIALSIIYLIWQVELNKSVRYCSSFALVCGLGSFYLIFNNSDWLLIPAVIGVLAHLPNLYRKYTKVGAA